MYNSKDEEPPTTIISRIRSLFSQTAEDIDLSYSGHALIPVASIPSQFSDQNLLDIHNQSEYLNPDILDMNNTVCTSTATPAHRFSDVKRILTDLAKPTCPSTSHTTPHSHFRINSDGSSVAGSGRSDISQSHSVSSALTNSNTPPLTPDSFNGLASVSSSGIPEHYQYPDSHPQQYQNPHQPSIHIHEEDHPQHIRLFSHSQGVKEGKKIQRPICYDTLIADITDEPPPFVHQEAVCDDTREEWYGLEYTLELSRRDRCGSNSCDQPSAGEHSKSRESWAVIHQGTVHPVLEDEEYHHWKRWHRYLDKQDEKRRMKKALVFMAQSEDLAHFYTEEMRTRDWIRWEQEQPIGVLNIGYAIEHLRILVEHRPDPYFPPMKHGLAWHLKRSRSVGCLRELSPLPVSAEEDVLQQLYQIDEVQEV